MTDTKPLQAAIIADVLPSDILENLKQALIASGFNSVLTLQDLPALEYSSHSPNGGLKYHLPESLKQVTLLVVDEHIGTRSAFEKYILLRATEEGRHMSVCQLISAGLDAPIFAAWAAGCEMCFTKETLNYPEFTGVVKRWLKSRTTEQH